MLVKIVYGARVFCDSNRELTGIVRRYATDPEHPDDAWFGWFEVEPDSWWRRKRWIKGYNINLIQNNMDNIPEVKGR